MMTRDGEIEMHDEYDSSDRPLGPEGCVFPGECCMPGPHYESECHTPAMLIALEEELLK